MKIRHLILTLFLVANSVAAWCGSLTATFYDDLSGAADWTATYFALDKAQIARQLGCTEAELLAQGGRAVVKYTPASGETVSVPINVTYKIYKDVDDSEVDATLHSALLLCQADMATTGRQVYYNQAELTEAIQAAETAKDVRLLPLCGWATAGKTQDWPKPRPSSSR